MFLHFPCKEFAEESGKTGLRADTPFLPAYHFTQSAAVCQRRIALWVKKIFRAAPHNSARDSSERFCPKIKFGKRRHTLCISSFTNCNIGAKNPLMSADAIMRCCPYYHSTMCQGKKKPPFARPYCLTNGDRFTCEIPGSVPTPPVWSVCGHPPALRKNRTPGHSFCRHPHSR